MSEQLVSLRIRPSRDGKEFTYFLDYLDEDGKRRRISLGHADKRKAERQCAQFERELRMGVVEPGSLKLSEFFKDSLTRTQGQVRESTLVQYRIATKRLIETVGNMDYLKVTHKHGELFIQACLDQGNSPATANKNIRSLKRLFQLAVQRGQLENNPFKYVQNPRVPRNKVRVYSEKEYSSLIRAATAFSKESTLRWDALIITALCTGMRRGELLNATWKDIDFEMQSIDVAPKKDTKETWQWHIKDNERRTLPLTEEIVNLLAAIQASLSDGYPYVFLPKSRYQHIQQRRQEGNWTVLDGICPVTNFTRHFKAILKKAGIEHGEFHDLRRTCLTHWLFNGLSEYDVMRLAGHSDFETTRRFYLAVRQDLVQRARAVSQVNLKLDFGTHLARTPFSDDCNKSASADNSL
jgi:integrase